MSPVPLPYTWEVNGDDLTIRVDCGPMNAEFRGTFSPDGTSFAGGWSPNPGADEQINVPYEFTARRLS